MGRKITENLKSKTMRIKFHSSCFILVMLTFLAVLSSLKGLESSSMRSRLSRRLTSSSSTASTSSGSGRQPDPCDEECLQHHGYYVAPRTYNSIATGVILPVSDHGRRKAASCCGPAECSCSWSYGLKSFLVQSLGQKKANTIFFKYSMGRHEELLRRIREQSSLKLTFYPYQEIANAVAAIRHAWNSANPDKAVDWTGKESTLIMTDCGFRQITQSDLSHPPATSLTLPCQP